jgi:hypothetical protein
LEDSLLVVAVREARVESSSLDIRVLASLKLRMDCSTLCRAAFSSAKARLAVDRVVFSLDNAFFSSAIKATNPETSRSQKKKNHRIEVVKEERVPSRSASATFRPSKKSATRRTESLASTVERIVELVPPAGGGAKLAGAGEDTCGTASGQSARFDGPPSEDFL